MVKKVKPHIVGQLYPPIWGYLLINKKNKNMRYFRYLPLGRYWIENNGKIVEAEITNIVFDFKSGGIKYTAQHLGSDFEFDSNLKAFDSKKEAEIGKYSNSYLSLSKQLIRDNGHVAPSESFTYDDCTCEFYVMDAAPKKIKCDILYVHINKNDIKVYTDSVYGQNERFVSMNECIFYSEMEFVDKDGNQSVKKSTFSQITLTPEQKEQFNKVIKTLKEAMDMGIKFIYDSDFDYIYPFNGKNCNFSVEYEDCQKYIPDLSKFEGHSFSEFIDNWMNSTNEYITVTPKK